jgi:hypothetical protein
VREKRRIARARAAQGLGGRRARRFTAGREDGEESGSESESGEEEKWEVIEVRKGEVVRGVQGAIGECRRGREKCNGRPKLGEREGETCNGRPKLGGPRLYASPHSCPLPPPHLGRHSAFAPFCFSASLASRKVINPSHPLPFSSTSPSPHRQHAAHPHRLALASHGLRHSRKGRGAAFCTVPSTASSHSRIPIMLDASTQFLNPGGSPKDRVALQSA